MPRWLAYLVLHITHTTNARSNIAMTANLLPTVSHTHTPAASNRRDQPNPGLIITPESLWVTSKNHHIKRNAPALSRLMQVIETDPRHQGLIADQVSVEKLRRAYEAIAETYVNPFHEVCAEYYTAPDEDPKSVQNRILATLCDLSKRYPEIPGIIWHVLGHIGTRPDPYAELSLLGDDDYAVGSATLNDAALHSLCMVARLKTLVDEHLSASVSAVIIHAHNCDCCIEAVVRPEGFAITPRTPEMLQKLFDAFVAQLLSEVIKTCGYDLPHAAA